MRRIEVEARDDGDRRDGGHVVVYLAGLERLAEGVAFFLRPLDSAGEENGLGELADEQRPVAVRPVDGGVEMVIGPEVTQHPSLVAGSPVEIEIPEGGVWSEFNWPAVRPREKSRRSRVSAVRAQPAVAQVRNGSDRVAADRPETAGATDIAATSGELNGARQASGNLHNGSAEVGPKETVREESHPMSMASPNIEDSAALRELEIPTYEEPPIGGQEYVVFYPHARGGKLGMPAREAGNGAGRKAKSLLPSTRMGAAVLAAVAVLGVQVAYRVAGGDQPTPAVASALSATSAPADASLYDLFAVGGVSPRGVAARDLPAAKALENAQAALLTPGAPRDVEEASFWLRRFLTASGSDERTRRVLTQLGTTFADSTNRPAEYGKARMVWELASAFGDPVAMCFVGTLNENGLGVSADRKVALQWYERAKQSGGCPSVDESIARVRK